LKPSASPITQEETRWTRFAQASERLATARTLDAIVDILRHTARDIVGAQGIAVIVRDGEQCFYAAEDAIGPLWAGNRFPLETCISGWAMTRRETVLISDIRLDARVPQAAYAPTFVRSLVMAPIGQPDPVAAIGAYWSDVRDHDPAEVRRLEALARAAAIAIQNARLLGDLQQSERDRSIALEAGRMGVWTLDLANNALETTPACRTIFGRDPALDFPFSALREALHPEDRARVFHEIDASIASHSDCDMEHRIITPQGEMRWVGVRAKPSYHPDGRARALSGVSVDITDRVRMEQERESFAAVLEQRVAQRTQELIKAQDALRHSQKLEAMGQLTGGVAHDFNNLLTPILGSLDLLTRRNLGDAREKRLIAGALQSAERARTLVQRLLAFARRQPLKARAVDVGMLLLDLSPLLEVTLGTQVHLALDMAPDTPPAHADQNQLEMALVNVAVNARDAMPSGGRLTISTRLVVEGAQTHVVIALRDTGVGMDEATQERAVEPFFSTKGIGKGTGLGLSMVHGLMAQLGGALRLSSAPGMGTTVELWLQVSPDALPGIAAPQAEPVFLARKTVLLVDDEALVRATTADMLTEFGLTVIEAQSGSEALAVIAQGHLVDLIVTDHMMPAMTGAQLAEAIRISHPELPLLLVSGYADLASIPVDVARLEKPFRQSDLARSIAGVLNAG
jgi:PAS domain S-box-containing protein